MAYLRFSFSRWYVYWTSMGGETKDEQAVQIHDKSGRGWFLTYEQLSEGLESVMESIRLDCERPHESRRPTEDTTNLPFQEWKWEVYMQDPDPASESELQELREALEEFMLDVENEFKNKDEPTSTGRTE